ncbi:ATP-grasp domain-containing protein [uncultured Winogradskyella sp.]|uniref:ATP-grasp domain-containing protein n=1 Tax=uncultured Winogradskyella sp. TaxID=395353 RepID=UPI00260587E2|nr:ATP-grasp domain-containing protein [uncultured Winogradskyella sp.]
MNSSDNTISVLIPDTDNDKLLSLQVVNCLSVKKNIKIYILTSKKSNHLRYSLNVKRVTLVPKCDSIEWINYINILVEKHRIDVILPVYDYAINTLIKYKNRLNTEEKLCVLPELRFYETASDKGLLYNHLVKYALPCPKSVIVKSDSLPNLSELNYPIIAKPVIGFSGGRRICVLNNYKDVIKYVNTVDYGGNAIYQNYINGYDLSCNLLCNNGELLAFTIQRAELSREVDFSPQSNFTFIKEPKLLDILKQIVKSLEWSGPANIDVRYSTDDNSFKIIEINSRYWVNVDASVLTNVNFPYLHCQLSLDKPILQPVESKTMTYLSFRGLIKTILEKPSTLFKFRFLKNHTPLKFALKDPLPMFYLFVWRTRNILFKKAAK